MAQHAFTADTITADGLTLTVKTAVPTPTLPYLLADPVFVMYDTSADLSNVTDKGVSGTGPFVFSACDDVTHNTTVVRNENYWGGEVKLAGIEFHVIADPATLNMSLQNGELDAAYSLLPGDVAAYEKDENFKVAVSSSMRTAFLNHPSDYYWVTKDTCFTE